MVCVNPRFNSRSSEGLDHIRDPLSKHCICKLRFVSTSCHLMMLNVGAVVATHMVPLLR